jgi:hypothetical protein
LLSLVLPFAIWFGFAHTLGIVAQRFGLSKDEYIWLGLLLAPLAPFILYREIKYFR